MPSSPVLPLPDAQHAVQRYEQVTIDELGTPLADVTFVVVDLETTGGSPKDSAITEIGAVKVRGGVVLGEFQTLVDPGHEIPPYISVLTGITSMMVAAAPRIGAVLPGVPRVRPRARCWSRTTRPFDLGFLKAACAENGLAWPAAASVDTAVLARRLLTRDEVPNCKLATLAPYFSATTSPTHRALDDAKATVDVLHGLFERLGPLGITSLEELTGLTRQVDPERLRKRHLADGVPRGPGVYLFRGPRDEPLYVGTSNDLRSRVRSYFSSGEQRSRITEMVALSQRVDAIPCAHDLEAAVRELRLIAEHKPRYNRRSRFPERALWVRLTEEPFPRLSVVRRVRPGAGVFLGPFPDRRAADAAVAAVHESLPLRQCTTRISARAPAGAACALAGMGRCGAPCTGAQSVDGVRVDRGGLPGRRRPGPARPRGARCSPGSTGWPPRSATRTRRCCATGSPSSSGRCAGASGWNRWPPSPSWSIARPDGAGGWHLSVVRRGRLVAAGSAPVGTSVARHAARPAGHRRDACPAPTTSRRPRSTRPSWCCAGWRSPAPGSSSSPARWPARRRAPARSTPSSPASRAVAPAATRSPTADPWAPAPAPSGSRRAWAAGRRPG